jgi:hypothetical protein
MQIVLYRPARTRLVGTVHRQEERVVSSEDSTEGPKDNTRGCIKHRLVNMLPISNRIRILN